MSNLTETARALADAFERKTRDNGESFYCLKDGRPDWMQDALHAAHDGGDMMPNDWSYQLASRMADHIAESLEYDSDKDRADIISEGADALVPCYNGERLAWLASHLSRAGFVDQAMQDYGTPSEGGIMAMIGCGIHAELEMIGHALFDAIESEADDDSDD
jgi:hypothetical protein